jgi:hypothetical protein
MLKRARESLKRESGLWMAFGLRLRINGRLRF